MVDLSRTHLHVASQQCEVSRPTARCCAADRFVLGAALAPPKIPHRRARTALGTILTNT
jgi:hypothetical protein